MMLYFIIATTTSNVHLYPLFSFTFPLTNVTQSTIIQTDNINMMFIVHITEVVNLLFLP